MKNQQDMSALLSSLKISPEQSTAKAKLPLLAITLGLFGVVLSGYYLSQLHDNDTDSLPPTLQTSIVSIATTTEIASVPQASSFVLEASGYLTARTQATISSLVTGRVEQVLIEEGQLVAAGQLLARLDDSLLQAELALAQTQLAAETANLAEVEVALQQAQLDFKRIQSLAERSLASQAELDNAQLNQASVISRLQQRQQQINVAEARLKVIQQKIQQLEIRAPFAGVVIAKSAQAGEMISPISAGGGFTRTGICTLVDMSSLEIIVDVNEANIQKISVGQKVVAKLNSYQDWEIPSRVLAIIPAADRNKATVRVRIEILSLDPRMLPDMGVKVAFIDSDNESSE